MAIELQGKRCFVTAAGQGIGRAIAVAMRNAGASVIASDVSDAALATRIKEARRALGDDGTTQWAIRTIHRRGYRFVVEPA